MNLNKGASTLRACGLTQEIVAKAANELLMTNVAEKDPFNDGRILSGRLIDKEINFTFSLWGRRRASNSEVRVAYHYWHSQQRKNVSLKNKRIDLAWGDELFLSTPNN